VRFQYLADHERQYVIRKACRSLGISRSGFYAYRTRTPSNRQLENELLSGKIRTLFEQHSGRYGAKRITHCLKDEGIKINRKRVAKLMRAMGLLAKGARRAYKNCQRQHTHHAGPNLIQQNGIAIHRNEVWLGDITYIPTKEGYLYLAAFLDLHTRKIVGWSISSTMTERLVADAFLQGFGREMPKAGLIVHTDQGSQFTSGAFLMLLRSKGAIPSNSRKGNPYDNAFMESFYKTLKRELVHDAGFKTKDEARKALFSYIELYYNSRRTHSALGYTAPRVYEELNS
jgi:putative transposase